MIEQIEWTPYEPKRFLLIWSLSRNYDQAETDLKMQMLHFHWKLRRSESVNDEVWNLFRTHQLDYRWRPCSVKPENPITYMVFYGLDFDQGWPDQFDGKEFWRIVDST